MKTKKTQPYLPHDGKIEKKEAIFFRNLFFLSFQGVINYVSLYTVRHLKWEIPIIGSSCKSWVVLGIQYLLGAKPASM